MSEAYESQCELCGKPVMFDGIEGIYIKESINNGLVWGHVHVSCYEEAIREEGEETMARKNPKIVLADTRKWAKDFYLGDGDPKDYPQAAKKIQERSFQVLSIHNAIDHQIDDYLSPEEVEILIHQGWQVEVKPYKPRL